MKHKHHILPKHMGGSNDPSNLIELTPTEHAEAHRLLYEHYGRWQDYVAWQGLAKLVSKEEHVKMLLSEAGKKGSKIRNAAGGNTGMKYSMKGVGEYPSRIGANNPCARSYEITNPDGDKHKVTSLKTWCELNSLNYNSFHNQCICRNKAHKGYRAKKI